MVAHRASRLTQHAGKFARPFGLACAGRPRRRQASPMCVHRLRLAFWRIVAAQRPTPAAIPVRNGARMARLKLEEPAARERLADFIASASAVRKLPRLKPRLYRAGRSRKTGWWPPISMAGGRRWCCAPMRPRVWPSAMAARRSSPFCRQPFAPGSAAPEPLWLCRDTAVLGQVFYLMRRAGGVAPGFRVVKDKSLGGDRVKLAERLGSELARITQ